MNTVSSDKTRIRALDVLRGLTVLSMVAFHTTYDLAYIFELPVPWFTSGPVQDIWRNSISWTFLFLAGWMCAYSRNNFKRAIRYGAFAILIWFATTLAAVDTSINFGIIYCMSVSTLIAALLRHVTKGKLNSKSCLIAAAACLVLFFATTGSSNRRMQPSILPGSVFHHPHLLQAIIILLYRFRLCIYAEPLPMDIG